MYQNNNQIKCEHVTTVEAAFMLCRLPQTLRKWLCEEFGLLHPIRICCRLAWRLYEIEIVRKGGRVINKDGRKTN